MSHNESLDITNLSARRGLPKWTVVYNPNVGILTMYCTILVVYSPKKILVGDVSTRATDLIGLLTPEIITTRATKTSLAG